MAIVPDDLCKELGKRIANDVLDGYIDKKHGYTIRQIAKMLENDELVPVVRCAECVWWNPPKVSITGKCAVANTHTTGNFYCQAGQKKERE